MLEGKSITPLFDNVLVMLDATEERVGLIFLPDRSKKTSQWGTVVAKGPDAENVQVGERVVSHKTGGMRFIVAGANYLMLKQREVLLHEQEDAQ